MTVTDQIKILDDKIKSNQAQYDLGREAAQISALSSKDLLEKDEYLTGKDWSVVEKTKFDYSPSGMVLPANIKNKTKTNQVDRKKKKQTRSIFSL